MSIERIAELAGVSIATVSNVINNKPKASKATIERVLQAMQELDYQPKITKHRTRPRKARKTNLPLQHFSLIIPNCSLAHFRIPLHGSLISAFNNAAYERGLSMILTRIPPGERLPSEHIKQNPDGIVFVQRKNSDAYLTGLKKIPKVGILGNYNEKMDVVCVNNLSVGRLAFNYLSAMDLKAYVCFFDELFPVQETRIKAFQHQMRTTNKPLIVAPGQDLILEDSSRVIPNFDRILNLLKKAVENVPLPFGLFCPTDLISTAAYPVLEKLGLKAGVDFKMISCDNEIPYLVGMTPLPGSIDINLNALAARALDTLLWRIQNPNEPHNLIMVEPKLASPIRN